jgi:DNA polymerase-3 subunit alpha
MVQFCKNNNQNSIAITEHGTINSFVDFWKECTKNEIKPILGLEAYEVDSYNLDSKRYHLILLAKNKQGFDNIKKIVEISAKNYYYKPRITIEDIRLNNLGEGIIATTACMGGRLNKGLSEGLNMKPYIQNLKSLFDDVYVELNAHSGEEQTEANKRLMAFSKEAGVPHVITADAHFLNKEDEMAHGIFVSNGKDRDTEEFYRDCFLQTSDDIINILGNTEDVVEGIKNTQKVADSIELYDIGITKIPRMPTINLEDGMTELDCFLKKLNIKFQEKKIKYNFGKEYEDRLEMELHVLKQLNYIGYFLTVSEIVEEFRKRGIPLGYGRGSVGGCLTAYILDISSVDSIKWDLDFTRFANLGRNEMADIDIDVSQARRGECIEIIKEMFGADRVAPVSTFNKFSLKVAIKDIGKTLNATEGKYFEKLDTKYTKLLSDMIPENENDIDKAMAVSENLSRELKNKPEYLGLIKRLSGLIKTQGTHASAILISPHPLNEYLGLNKAKDSTELMAGLEMHNAMDDLGLLKLDLLGLRNLDVIDETLKSVGLTWEDINIQNLNFEDKKVYDNIYNAMNTQGVFQCESVSGRRIIEMIGVDCIDDVIAQLALNRPGANSFAPTYGHNKKNNIKSDEIHPDLSYVFEKTYGVLLYQEQALSIFRHLTFEETKVDKARRAIGKKIESEMNLLKKEFDEKAFAQNWVIEDIDKIWALMVRQSAYSFNKAHSCAYGLLSYVTAYLKENYKVEFMTALLNSVKDDHSKLGNYLDDCTNNGIKLCLPSVQSSGRQFSFNKADNSITVGLECLKGIKEEFLEKIFQNRPFKGYTDFENKIKPSITQITSLIKAGAFGDWRNGFNYLINTRFPLKTYKAVKTLPSKIILKEQYGIDTKDKNIALEQYNKFREIENDKQELIKRDRMQKEFEAKYFQDSELWEFETIGMFITHNPFKDYETTNFNELEEMTNLVCIGCIGKIENKKDRNGKKYVMGDLYTKHGVMKFTVFAHVLSKDDNINLIKKNSTIVTIGDFDREKNSYIVKKIKSFEVWKLEKTR